MHPSPARLRLLVPACAVFLLVSAYATTAPLEAGDGRPEALTALEAGPFRSAHLVVVARLENVTDVRAPGGALGRQVVRVSVGRVFKGSAVKGMTISVLVQGQRPTLDPSRPSVPYFQAGGAERFVLFLGAPRGGVAYALETLFDADGSVGDEKIAAVAAVAEASEIRSAEAKGRRVLGQLMNGLRGADRWTKAYAARELAWLARKRPQVFDPATRSTLRRLSAHALTADQRHWIREVFKALEVAKGSGVATPTTRAQERDPWRAGFLGLVSPEERQNALARLVRGGREQVARHGWWAWRRLEPSLRLWFARVVGEREVAKSSEMRALYAAEEDGEVREGIVRAVGLLGGEDDVAWLDDRASSPSVRRAALLALARIRTATAQAALGRWQAQAARAKEAHLAAWIGYLRSSAFEESERRRTRRASR